MRRAIKKPRSNRPTIINTAEPGSGANSAENEPDAAAVNELSNPSGAMLRSGLTEVKDAERPVLSTRKFTKADVNTRLFGGAEFWTVAVLPPNLQTAKPPNPTRPARPLRHCYA